MRKGRSESMLPFRLSCSSSAPVRFDVPCASVPAGEEVEMKVKDVMHEGATWVGPETTVAELARTMRDQDIGSIPIGENDRLIGMVTDRDIVVKGLADGHDVSMLSARDVMTGPILYCRADEDVEDAVRLMEEHEVRRLPVIDANKRMVGILALGDISSHTGRELSGEVLKAVSEHHA
jgi:CBS domain-containing protein